MEGELQELMNLVEQLRADDLTKVKRVHRSMLRVWVGTDPLLLRLEIPFIPLSSRSQGMNRLGTVNCWF